jgi:hypothetical protein
MATVGDPLPALTRGRLRAAGLNQISAATPAANSSHASRATPPRDVLCFAMLQA